MSFLDDLEFFKTRYTNAIKNGSALTLIQSVYDTFLQLKEITDDVFTFKSIDNSRGSGSTDDLNNPLCELGQLIGLKKTTIAPLILAGQNYDNANYDEGVYAETDTGAEGRYLSDTEYRNILKAFKVFNNSRGTIDDYLKFFTRLLNFDDITITNTAGKFTVDINRTLAAEEQIFINQFIILPLTIEFELISLQ